MNYRLVVNVIGFILLFLGFSMIFSISWSLYYNDDLNYKRDLFALIKSMVITIFSGTVLILGTYKKKKSELSVRDGFAVVTLGWIFMVSFSALPYYFTGSMNYIDCFFESMSGLTTTGASVIEDLDSMSHGILFWRSFTQFIGGMGIIVFSIAILPLLGFGGVQLFKAEVAGPTADKLTPRIKQTAKYLWAIYIGLIVVETIVLYVEGKVLGLEKLNFFHSLCHSFCTIATAGFSTYNTSISAFNHPVVTWTIIIFMFLSATNFTLHFLFLVKGSFDYLKNPEFKVYASLSVLITIIFFANIYNADIVSNGQALTTYGKFESSAFYAISFLSTTGFSGINYLEWGNFNLIIIFILLFIGGCAGSTTGGIKLIRTLLIFKYLGSTIRKLIHPNGVYPIKIGKKEVSDDIVQSVLGFYLVYIFIFMVLSLMIAFTAGTDFISSLSISASSIGNIGPGLGVIGPLNNWASLPDSTKWVTSFCMLLGRLEIFTVIILFSKTYWRK
ncbi:MAG: potassium transporter [Candidatus Marinimicrobia bacterium]|nr:potassium transporter [Candidatus Neomarinimicrobiota bacterium]